MALPLCASAVKATPKASKEGRQKRHCSSRNSRNRGQKIVLQLNLNEGSQDEVTYKDWPRKQNAKCKSITYMMKFLVYSSSLTWFLIIIILNSFAPKFIRASQNVRPFLYSLGYYLPITRDIQFPSYLPSILNVCKTAASLTAF